MSGRPWTAPLPRTLLPDTAAVDARRAGCRSAASTSLDLAERARHAAVRLRRGPPAGPLPRGGRRVRRRRGLRRQGVPLHGDGPAGRTRRACTSTWPPAASCTWPSPPASRPTGSCCTATTSPTTSCAGAHRARRRPHRRRQLRRARPPRAPASSRRARRPRVLVRVTPGVEAHTHEYVMTGQDDSKFGFGLAQRRRGRGRRARCGGSPGVELVGVHAHIGSQIFLAALLREGGRGAGRFVAPARRCPSCASAAASACPTSTGEEAPTITEWADDAAGRRAPAAGIAATGHRRAGPGDRRHRRPHALPRGHDQGDPRRAHLRLGRRRHERQPPARPLRQRLRGVPAPRRPRAERPRVVTVVGKHCESGDVVVRDAQRARPTSPSATSSARRSPAPTATRWRRTTTRCRGRRWCSSATATPGSSCAARRSTTCSASTSSVRWDRVNGSPVRVGLLGLRQRRAPRWSQLIDEQRRRHRRPHRRCASRWPGSRCATSAKDRGRSSSPPGILTDDAASVVTDPDIDVVVEVIGGIEPAAHA